MTEKCIVRGHVEKTKGKIVKLFDESGVTYEIEESQALLSDWEEAAPIRGVKYNKTFVQCSNCKVAQYLGFNMRYCPNCGSKMNARPRK